MGRSAALVVLAGSLAVLVVGLVLTVLAGPGLLIAVLGALGMLGGLALLMVENRGGDRAASPDGPPCHKR